MIDDHDITSAAPDAEDESALRAKAREAIRSGALPNAPPEHMWGGPGEGARCTICGTPVRPDESEFEIEFASTGNGRETDRHHVHPRCLAAWELEIQQLDGRALPATSEPTKMPGRASEPTTRRASA